MLSLNKRAIILIALPVVFIIALVIGLLVDRSYTQDVADIQYPTHEAQTNVVDRAYVQDVADSQYLTDEAQENVEYTNYVHEEVTGDTLPTISGDINFHIQHIAPGEVILLGILDFEPKDVYELSFSATEGQGVFIGISDTPYATNIDDYGWAPFLGGSARIDGSTQLIRPMGIEFVYLYVGSDNRVDAISTELHDIAVSLRLLSE